VSEVRAVIWDMGGILYLTPFEVFDEVERDLGLEPGILPRGPFEPAGDPEYAKCSTGELSEGDYWRGFHERLSTQGIDVDIAAMIDWSDRLRPEVMDAIASLDGHYLQATLSNDSSRWLGEGWWETWPYRKHFASVIDVVTLGVRKPHPDTYLVSARALGVEPGECLFVDDMQVNVDGAEAVGMRGFFFDHTDVPASVRRLLAMLLPNEEPGSV
jgi:putative hydrolase of the HAD superfamily